MKRAMNLACLLTALLAISVDAAQPAPEPQAESAYAVAKEAPADAPEPVIPKRELVFEEQSEPVEIALFSADPEALQQKFAVVVKLDAMRVFVSPKWRLPDESAHRGFSILQSSLRHSEGVPSTLLRSLAQQTPKDRLPSNDLVEALTRQTPLYVRDYRGMVARVPDDNKPDGYSYESTIQFLVLAPTPDRAKELAGAVLTFFDYGFSYPVQGQWLIAKQAKVEELATKREELSQVEEELRECEKQREAYAQYEDVTTEALNGLITQQRLISVDLAGVQARIKACAQILAKREVLSQNQIDQVEQIKITAEIELVGLDARKASIDQIVEKAGKHKKLSQDLFAGRKRESAVRREIESCQGRIEAYESERARVAPFSIRGGALPIRPIKWKSDLE